MWLTWSNGGVPLAEAAAGPGVPRKTATRWLAAYQANGLEGLRRLDRADRGGRRLPQEMIELIEAQGGAQEYLDDFAG